jgi:hypothetical protein
MPGKTAFWPRSRRHSLSPRPQPLDCTHVQIPCGGRCGHGPARIAPPPPPPAALAAARNRDRMRCRSNSPAEMPSGGTSSAFLPEIPGATALATATGPFPVRTLRRKTPDRGRTERPFSRTEPGDTRPDPLPGQPYRTHEHCHVSAGGIPARREYSRCVHYELPNTIIRTARSNRHPARTPPGFDRRPPPTAACNSIPPRLRFGRFGEPERRTDRSRAPVHQPGWKCRRSTRTYAEQGRARVQEPAGRIAWQDPLVGWLARASGHA